MIWRFRSVLGILIGNITLFLPISLLAEISNQLLTAMKKLVRQPHLSQKPQTCNQTNAIRRSCSSCNTDLPKHTSAAPEVERKPDSPWHIITPYKSNKIPLPPFFFQPFQVKFQMFTSNIRSLFKCDISSKESDTWKHIWIQSIIMCSYEIFFPQKSFFNHVLWK